ncbi:MAG: HlyD family efflux transporter periplasmic adaptor subunit [bacterium]|jgi:HlyD family secretion protein|nr:HlyD family efflux transporter periplasmic adaptor subunit [bacterium]
MMSCSRWTHGRCRQVLLTLGAGLLAVGCGGKAGGGRPAGSLEATDLRLAPSLAARVLEVRAVEGGVVAAGDTLVVLDLSLQQLQRAQSAAGLATLAARLKRANDGGREAETALQLAERTLERVTALHAAGSATDQLLDETRAQRDQWVARRLAATHEGEALAAERLALEATLAVQDRLLADAVLTAPGPGTVLERYAEPGEWLAPGQPALLLADLSHLELRFYLGAPELGLVRPGLALQLEVDAFPGESFPATVSWVSSVAEFTPRNTQTREARAQLVHAVRATVENPAGRLLIGMPAEVILADTP